MAQPNQKPTETPKPAAESEDVARVQYKKLTTQQEKLIRDIKMHCNELAVLLATIDLPNANASRMQDKALESAEVVVFWATKAITA